MYIATESIVLFVLSIYTSVVHCQCDAAASVAPSFFYQKFHFILYVSSINDESPMTVALLMIEK